jgi:hypothetical protein
MVSYIIYIYTMIYKILSSPYALIRIFPSKTNRNLRLVPQSEDKKGVIFLVAIVAHA